MCITHTHLWRCDISSKDILKLLQKYGWQIVSQERSHIKLKHPTQSGRVIVPHPNKDLPIGTYRSILKQAGLTGDEQC